MKQVLSLKVQSAIDVITNSSTELFSCKMGDTSLIVPYFESLIATYNENVDDDDEVTFEDFEGPYICTKKTLYNHPYYVMWFDALNDPIFKSVRYEKDALLAVLASDVYYIYSLFPIDEAYENETDEIKDSFDDVDEYMVYYFYNNIDKLKNLDLSQYDKSVRISYTILMESFKEKSKILDGLPGTAYMCGAHDNAINPKFWDFFTSFKDHIMLRIE